MLSEEERLQFRLEPTPAVVEAAQDTIRGHESAIDDIEGRIRHLLDQVQDLRYGQARHRAAIERTRGLITLARRIPEELLIRIFGHCVEDGWTRAPVVVSHVCSAWRKAAHAPKVWSHVYVRCDDANVVERTKFWLKMAKGADLHITVATSWRTPEWQIDEVMSLLAARKEQWSSLKVEADTLRHADLVLTHCTGRMPELRRVNINTSAADLGETDSVQDLSRLPETFDAEHAPRLSALGYVSSVIPAMPVFPAHITSLVLEVRESPSQRPLSTASIIDILTPLSELRTLTLSMPLTYDQDFVPEPDPARAASLPSLTTFTLYGPTDQNELLPHIHTPALRHLHLRSLEDVGYRQQPIGPSLTQFLERSAPPLELLELHDIDLTPETFATVFAALPGLRELRLHESSISDATVRLLHGPRGLCPRLARLDLRWCGMLHGRALVDLVQSRHVVDDLVGSVADPIEEVGVINCCFVLEDDVLDLARMTVCRIVTRDGDDYCRTRDCCSNLRYRTRLRLRRMSDFIDKDAGIRLVL